MSEYQYYEFRTVGRALTREEERTVNTWSSRGNVTSVSASFEYHYSDFRQDVRKCLEGYFDVMLYIANWGSKRVMFRLPVQLADIKALKNYEWDREYGEHSISITKSKEYVIIDIQERLEEGYDEWIEGEGTLSGFAPLWNDVVAGNYSALYLTWLHFARLDQETMPDDDDDDDDFEGMKMPPIPAGIGKISSTMERYLDFWGISKDLQAAAAQYSPEQPTISTQKLEENIQNLPMEEKNAFLKRLLHEEPHLRAALLKRLEIMSPAPAANVSTAPTLQMILDAETEIAVKRRQSEQAEAARKRRIELGIVEKQADRVWQSVYENLELKIVRGYDQAFKDLKDLRDLAEMRGTLQDFNTKMREIIDQYGRFKAFASRLQTSKLGYI